MHAEVIQQHKDLQKQTFTDLNTGKSEGFQNI